MASVLLVPDLLVEQWPSMDRYAARLAAHLPAVAPDLDIRLAAPTHDLTTARRPVAAAARRYVARYVSYPGRVRALAGDVLHVLDHSYGHLLPATRPSVVTVHDLQPVKDVRRPGRGLRTRLRRHALERVLRGLRQADRWIVATAWMAEELEQWLGRSAGIARVPYGVDDAFFHPPPTPRDAWRHHHGIPAEAFLVLHVGSVVPRKNFPAVLGCVAGLRAAGLEAWLVQAGGALAAQHRADMEALDIAPVVTALGPVDEAELRSAYHAADVLLVPSLYEGFGLPLLEAMAAGLPVVAADIPPLVEASAGAAVTVAGREVEPYVRAVCQLAEDAERRRVLAERGRAHARRFRWAETARLTAEVYRDLVA